MSLARVEIIALLTAIVGWAIHPSPLWFTLAFLAVVLDRDRRAL